MKFQFSLYTRLESNSVNTPFIEVKNI